MSRRRQLLTYAVGVALVLGSLSWLTGFAPKPLSAWADTCSDGSQITITDSPCDGLPGSAVVVDTNLDCPPGGEPAPDFTWDGDYLADLVSNEDVTVFVPSSATAGTHFIGANCNVPGFGSVSVPFTVDDPTSSSTTPTTTPTTESSTEPTTQPTTKPTSASTTPTTRSTTVQRTTPTTAPTTTTTTTTTGTTGSSTTTPSTSGTTTSTSATSSSSTTAPTSGTPTLTTTPTTASTAPTTGVRGTPTTQASSTPTSTPGHVLKLSDLSVSPGQEVTATGNGCAAGAKVALAIGGAAIGDAIAAVDGTYRAPLQIGSVPVGRYTVTAHCGPVVADAPLDVVLASQVSADTSTLSIMVFVILFTGFLYRRRLLPPARSTPPTEKS